MGRKSSADEGPVHSPKRPSSCKETEKGTKQETQQKKQETKQAKSSKQKPKQAKYCMRQGTIYSTLQKKMTLH